MYRRPLRSDEIYHSWLSKGAKKKNHKYIARINLGDKFRYFYDSKALQAFRDGVDDVKDAVKNKIDYHVTGEGYKRDAKEARRESTKAYQEAYNNQLSAKTKYETLPYTEEYRNASDFRKNVMRYRALNEYMESPSYDGKRRQGEGRKKEAEEAERKYKTRSIKGISEEMSKKATNFISKIFNKNKGKTVRNWNDPRPKKFTEDIITEKEIHEKTIPEDVFEEQYITEQTLTGNKHKKKRK